MRGQLLGCVWASALVASLSWGACSSDSASPQNEEELCDGGESLCGGRCVITSSDPAHCGFCDAPCGPEQRCEQGRCVEEDEGGEGCGEGLTACGDACVNLLADPHHCGECGETCSEEQECVGGACVSTEVECDEECPVDRVCENGTCVCAKGLEDCGVICVDSARDAANCGECGNACAWGASCEEGVCVCPPGTTLCDDACVDTESDSAHCGDCFQRCMDLPNAGMPICRDGECRFDCDFGYADCDDDWQTGCETSVSDNQDHCGGCNLSCDGLPEVEEVSCAFASCQIQRCVEGRANCDFDPTTGCETDTTSDPDHCGGCGMACRALPQVESTGCELGNCVFTCQEGWEDCDGIADNGCEVDVFYGTTGQCGGCDIECGPSEHCWEGECAVDPVFANWPIPPVGARPFDTSKDGITLDPITGLEWERSPPPTATPFQQAEDRCANLDLDGRGWRMPSPVELLSIVDYSRASPAVDPAAFPGTDSANYWTSKPDLSSTSSIWVVNFDRGTVASFSADRPVRCVRGAHRLEGDRYRVGTHTVEDLVTGLEWPRESTTSPGLLADAQAACEDMQLDGKSDWRLPTVKELMSIFLPTTKDRVDRSLFTAIPSLSSTYWSSTKSTNGNLLYLNFGGGNALVGSVAPDVTAVLRRYRCVRTTAPAP